QTDLYSDTLVAYLHRTNRTITYAQADGRVRIVQGPHTADSRRAIYEPAGGKVTLLGSPSLLVYPDSDQPPPQRGALADSDIFRLPSH
ncbi:MAG: hypothetical protein HYY91_02570, partial [Candidatus Omnitrophica bacterium]|nr:hypothetical protein [Candidatus Omnitrophota bacterium]